jgi:hypothetical protein
MGRKNPRQCRVFWPDGTLCGIIAQGRDPNAQQAGRFPVANIVVILSFRKGEMMKKIATFVMVLCLGAFLAAGCNKPQPPQPPKAPPAKTIAKPAAKEDAKAADKKAEEKKNDEKK